MLNFHWYSIPYCLFYSLVVAIFNMYHNFNYYLDLWNYFGLISWKLAADQFFNLNYRFNYFFSINILIKDHREFIDH